MVPSLHHATETIMTLGNILYLALAIGTFGLFSATLAYQTWRQSRVAPKPARAPVRHVPSGISVGA
jgi:hypothetical protein